jgi:hypothetical protein
MDQDVERIIATPLLPQIKAFPDNATQINGSVWSTPSLPKNFIYCTTFFTGVN